MIGAVVIALHQHAAATWFVADATAAIAVIGDSVVVVIVIARIDDAVAVGITFTLVRPIILVAVVADSHGDVAFVGHAVAVAVVGVHECQARRPAQVATPDKRRLDTRPSGIMIHRRTVQSAEFQDALVPQAAHEQIAAWPPCHTFGRCQAAAAARDEPPQKSAVLSIAQNLTGVVAGDQNVPAPFQQQRTRSRETGTFTSNTHKRTGFPVILQHLVGPPTGNQQTPLE